MSGFERKNSLPPALPQCFEPTPERLRLFGEQAMGDARGALRQRGGTLGAGRREPRSPMRQRLMWRGERAQHFEILAATEPFAQPLRLLGPHSAKARP